MSFELDCYRSMLRIRRFEETVLDEFKRGVFSGTTHTSIGQEANAVGVIGQLAPDDVIVTNHRCHGHYLAYGGDMRALFAEMMGRSTGVCGGRGGSQHIHWRNLYSNGVQGGIAPIAVGMALAEKRKGSGNIVSVFVGDGTFGQGVLYEALNMASLWSAPVLFVVEHNGIAQTTPTCNALAGTISARFSAFDIDSVELDTSDVHPISQAAAQIAAAVRADKRPAALILNTARLGPHSKGDDTRSAGTLEVLWAQRDPVSILGSRLDSGTANSIAVEVESEVRTAFEQALADPYPTLAAEAAR